MGLPQPFADALKLFTKEQAHPHIINTALFYLAPAFILLLALITWTLFPTTTPSASLPYGVLFFLCISRLHVYTTLLAGWSSNSKYALIGALRGVAQTISYEISLALTLLALLFITGTYNVIFSAFTLGTWGATLILPLFFVWIVTALAELNRTPFDHAEGESELVSGFNTEYSSGPFALIFIAEYTSILAIGIFTVALFSSSTPAPIYGDLFFVVKTLCVSFSFIWIRGTLPRIRYDRLMSLTWKVFLPTVIAALILLLALLAAMWCRAG